MDTATFYDFTSDVSFFHMLVVFMRILKFFCALFVLELLLLFFPIFFDFRKLFSMLEKIYNKVLIMGEAAMYDRYGFFFSRTIVTL